MGTESCNEYPKTDLCFSRMAMSLDISSSESLLPMITGVFVLLFRKAYHKLSGRAFSSPIGDVGTSSLGRSKVSPKSSSSSTKWFASFSKDDSGDSWGKTNITFWGWLG